MSNMESATSTENSAPMRKLCAQDFKILAQIGAGGYGRVYLVKRRRAKRALPEEQAKVNVSSNSSVEPKSENNTTVTVSDEPQQANKAGQPEGLSSTEEKEQNDTSSAEKPGKGTETSTDSSPGTTTQVQSETRDISVPGTKSKSTRYLAMKVISKKKIFESRSMRHCRSERLVLACVEHPFIVKLRYAFQSPAYLYLICDFAQGGELFQRINETGEMKENDVQFYAAELVLALSYCHSLGIVYRDLKPENIVLGADGHMVLTDFGLAKKGDGAFTNRLVPETSEDSEGSADGGGEDAEAKGEERKHTFCGTYEYMSPEMLLGKPQGAASDWWALGCLIYEMLCGSTPFYSGCTKKVQENVLKKKLKFPVWVMSDARSLLKGLLRKDPSKRLQNVEKIKKHAFFRGIDWRKLARKQVPPPFVPDLQGGDDISRFTTRFDHSESMNLELGYEGVIPRASRGPKKEIEVLRTKGQQQKAPNGTGKCGPSVQRDGVGGVVELPEDPEQLDSVKILRLNSHQRVPTTDEANLGIRQSGTSRVGDALSGPVERSGAVDIGGAGGQPDSDRLSDDEEAGPESGIGLLSRASFQKQFEGFSYQARLSHEWSTVTPEVTPALTAQTDGGHGLPMFSLASPEPVPATIGNTTSTTNANAATANPTTQSPSGASKADAKPKAMGGRLGRLLRDQPSAQASSVATPTSNQSSQPGKRPRRRRRGRGRGKGKSNAANPTNSSESGKSKGAADEQKDAPRKSAGGQRSADSKPSVPAEPETKRGSVLHETAEPFFPCTGGSGAQNVWSMVSRVRGMALPDTAPSANVWRRRPKPRAAPVMFSDPTLQQISEPKPVQSAPSQGSEKLGAAGGSHQTGERGSTHVHSPSATAPQGSAAPDSRSRWTTFRQRDVQPEQQASTVRPGWGLFRPESSGSSRPLFARPQHSQAPQAQKEAPDSPQWQSVSSKKSRRRRKR